MKEIRKPVNTRLIYEDGKTYVVVTYIDKDKKIKFEHIIDPIFSFRITNPELFNIEERKDLRSYQKFVKKEETIEIVVKYNKLLESMIEIADSFIDVSEYQDFYKNYPNKRGILLSYLHMLPFFHGTTDSLADYYMDYYKSEYSQNIQVDFLPKAYYDIEVDSYKYPKFVDEELAPRPINSISLLLPVNGTDTLFGLFSIEQTENYKNESLSNFISNEENLDRFYSKYLKFLKGEGFTGNLEIEFYEREIDIIYRFFEILNANPTAFAHAWNQTFDLLTFINRLNNVYKIDPKDVFSIKSPKKFRKVSYYPDKNAKKIEQKRDRWNISCNTNFTDQLINYARRRETGAKRDSNKLDDILFSELNKNKVELEPYNVTNVAYFDFELFMEYSLTDSFRLYQLNNFVQDTDNIYQIAYDANTRFEKALTKTTSIGNKIKSTALKKGFILSNNRNRINKPEKRTIRGAYVANLNLINDVGRPIFSEKRSNKLFKNVCDFDFKSQYPLIIYMLRIDELNFISRPIFPNDEVNEDGINKTTILADMLLARDFINIGNQYFNLPSRLELVNNFSKEIE